MVNGLLALILLGVSAPIGAQPEVVGLAASGVYEEDFSTYAQKEYVKNAEWDVWEEDLKLSLQDSIHQHSPDTMADGTGGFFIAWVDRRNGDSDIYAQRLDADGNHLWKDDLRVNTDTGNSSQEDVQLAPDGSGGVLIVWTDHRNDTSSIYAQQVDGNGNRFWPQDARVNASLEESGRRYPAISADKIGGFFVVWEDYWKHNMYIQRVRINGTRAWTSDIQVNMNSGAILDQPPAITTNTAGDALVIWGENRGNGDNIYAQRVDTIGNRLWLDDQRVNETADMVWAWGLEAGTIIGDNYGGAIVAWVDERGGSDRYIYAQRINDAGARLWTSDVRINTNASLGPSAPDLTADGTGGALVVWDSPYGTGDGVYVQNLDENGNLLWPSEKRVDRDGVEWRLYTTITMDGNGGGFVAWMNNNGAGTEIRAQHFDEDGNTSWIMDAHVNSPLGRVGQRRPSLTSDGNSGVFITWSDYRNDFSDIYIRRLDGSGNHLWREVRVNTDPGIARQTSPIVEDDSSGGVFVAWEDNRNKKWESYSQHVDENGNLLWNQDVHVGSGTFDIASNDAGKFVGVWITDAKVYAQCFDETGAHLWPEDIQVNLESDILELGGVAAASDGNGGFYAVWWGKRTGEWNLYAQRINATGHLMWTRDKQINVDSEVEWSYSSDPTLTKDQNGGLFVVWWDDGNGNSLYSQRINENGDRIWVEDLFLAWGWSPAITTDSKGGFFIAWEQDDSYVQHVGDDGTFLWSENLSLGSDSSTSLPAVAVNDATGLFVAWEDWSNGDSDIYVQRINDEDYVWGTDLRVVDSDLFYFPFGTAQSREVDATDDTITEATLTAQYILQGGSVDFYLTNDGGDHWAAVQPGVTHVFTTTGSDLRWRVEMASDPVWRNRSPIVDSLRIEYATTSADGDDYELDDACNQAQPIQVSGVAQTHNFHQYQDSDWVWFEAQAGTTYLIQTANTGARADTVLELYNQCGQPPDATDDNAFGPGATLSFEAPTSGTYYVRVLQHDGTVCGADTDYDLTVRAQQPSQGVAIIVAGRDRQDDYRQPIIKATANLAYQTFQGAGFADADVYYLNSDLGQLGVDAAPSWENVRDAIQDWARTRVGLGTPLWLYLADHGQVDRFHNEVDEVVTAGELNLWLSNLEATSGVDQINVIIDACHSGSFIDAQEQGDYGLEEISGHGRVVVASTTYSSQAYAPGGSNARMYFSAGFWRALGEGQTLWHAFLAGRSEVESGGVGQCGDYAFDFFCQRPWLDDTGDAWFDGADGQLAQTRGLAASFGGGVAPYIDWVQVGEVTEGQASVEAQVRDDGSVARVWLRVFAPSFEPPTGEDGSISVIDVPEADLGAASGDVFALDYTGFTEEGVYQIVVYAMDDEGNVSVPRSVLVGGQKVYLPLVMRRQ